LDYGQYKTGKVLVNGQQMDVEKTTKGIKIKRDVLKSFSARIEILAELV